MPIVKCFVNLISEKMTTHLHHQRVYSYRKKGQFYSRKVGYTGKYKELTSTLEEAAKVVWEDTQDDLKLSPGNEAGCSYFLPGGVNTCYSYNCIDQNGCPPNLTRRYAYRIHTAEKLNPHTLKIHQMPGCMIDLVTKVTKILSDKDEIWANWLAEHPFNAVTTKTYYSYQRKGNRISKKTNKHPDQRYNYKTRRPSKGDLVPGAPIAIITFGDPKNLWFQRCCHGKPTKTPIVHIPQRSGTLFVLDGRDEEPDEDGCSWVHRADMENSSENNFTIAFVLRSLKSWEYVNPDGTLAYPRLSIRESEKLERAEKLGIQKTKDYYTRRWELEIRVAWFLYLRKHFESRQAKLERQRLAKNQRRREIRRLKKLEKMK